MRVAIRSNPSRRPSARTASVPAPVLGWNARDELANMDPRDAIALENMFATTSNVEVRRGHSSHATGLVSFVETLMEYASPTSRKLIAAANKSFYDVSSNGAVGAAQESGHTNDRWQYVNFGTSAGHFIEAVNGDDTPRYFDGTVWTNASITGLTASNLIHIMSHQNRLFFVEKSTLKFWYLPVSSIQGAATSFDLASLSRKGGSLLAMQSWTLDSGAGMDDLAVFVTDQGEAFVYEGTNPASDWTLRGIFSIGKPIGRRCMLKLGGDLIIITEDGYFPLSKALITGRVRQDVSISDKISKAVLDASRTYKSNFGWEAILYPKNSMLVFNVPIRENVQMEQHVVNTITGAWCKFTALNANCWSLHNEELYFGGNGTVYKADTGTDDAGAAISWKMRTSFNYFGIKGQQKHFKMLRPIVQTEMNVTATIGLNVDFEEETPSSTLTFNGSSGASWNSSPPWDTTAWGNPLAAVKPWTSAAKIGYCASLYLSGTSQYFSFGIQAGDFVFEAGGVL